jgi:hypothetical protein
MGGHTGELIPGVMDPVEEYTWVVENSQFPYDTCMDFGLGRCLGNLQSLLV